MSTMTTDPGTKLAPDPGNVHTPKPGKHPRPRGLLIPAILFQVVVTQIPFVVTITYAFRQWNLLRPDSEQHWVGLKNFKDLATNEPSLVKTVWQTLLLTGSVVVVSMLLGLLLALFLNQRFPGRGAVRTLLITPMLVMPVVAGVLWKRLLLDSGSGLVPWLAEKFGHDGYAPLTASPMLWIVIILVWQWAPFSMLILLSGLSSRDPNTVEAASIDQAGPLQIFLHITLPHLRSYLAVSFLLSIVLVLPTFGVIYVTTAGGPGYSTTNLAYAVYQQAFANYSVGGASALALVDAVFVIIALTGIFKVMGGHLVRGEEIK